MDDMDEIYSTLLTFGIEHKVAESYKSKKSIKKLFLTAQKSHETLVMFVIEKILIEYDYEKYEILVQNLETNHCYSFIDCFYDPLVLVQELNLVLNSTDMKELIFKIIIELNDFGHIHQVKKFCFYLFKFGLSYYVNESFEKIYDVYEGVFPNISENVTLQQYNSKKTLSKN